MPRQPTPGFLPQQDESDFWRNWNSGVADQWNTYDQTGEANPLNFGNAYSSHQLNQRLAALPFEAQQSYLMNQHRVGQDLLQNQMARQQEGRLQSGQQFNQAVDRERLRMDMEAAKRKGMVDPFEAAATRMQVIERGLGVNPLEALSFAENSPDWQKTGQISFPGRWQLNPNTGKPEQLPGKQLPYNQEMHDFLSNLRSQIIPGYYTPRQQQAQADLTLPMPAYAAMQASRVNPTPRTPSTSAPENDPQFQGFQALKAKREAERNAAKLKSAQHYQSLSEGGFIPSYSYELGGP